MKSKVFSVLKIAVIAMMLVWAVGGPTQANAQQSCNGGCANQCAIQMGQCTEYGAVQTYCSWQQNGCITPSGPCYGDGYCIMYYYCVSAFESCMANCGCTVH